MKHQDLGILLRMLRPVVFALCCEELTEELKALDPDVQAAEGLSEAGRWLFERPKVCPVVAFSSEEALVQEANSEMKEAHHFF